MITVVLNDLIHSSACSKWTVDSEVIILAVNIGHSVIIIGSSLNSVYNRADIARHRIRLPEVVITTGAFSFYVVRISIGHGLFPDYDRIVGGLVLCPCRSERKILIELCSSMPQFIGNGEDILSVLTYRDFSHIPTVEHITVTGRVCHRGRSVIMFRVIHSTERSLAGRNEFGSGIGSLVLSEAYPVSGKNICSYSQIFCQRRYDISVLVKNMDHFVGLFIFYENEITGSYIKLRPTEEIFALGVIGDIIVINSIRNRICRKIMSQQIHYLICLDGNTYLILICNVDRVEQNGVEVQGAGRGDGFVHVLPIPIGDCFADIFDGPDESFAVPILLIIVLISSPALEDNSAGRVAYTRIIEYNFVVFRSCVCFLYRNRHNGRIAGAVLVEVDSKSGVLVSAFRYYRIHREALGLE